MSNAYEVTEEDVENVLRSNALAVANTNGKSFESMANEIFGTLNFDLIEQAALYDDSLDEQTDYANDEIARQLRESGVLEPLKQVGHEGGLAAAREKTLAARREVLTALEANGWDAAIAPALATRTFQDLDGKDIQVNAFLGKQTDSFVRTLYSDLPDDSGLLIPYAANQELVNQFVNQFVIAVNLEVDRAITKDRNVLNELPRG